MHSHSQAATVATNIATVSFIQLILHVIGCSVLPVIAAYVARMVASSNPIASIAPAGWTMKAEANWPRATCTKAVVIPHVGHG